MSTSVSGISTVHGSGFSVSCAQRNAHCQAFALVISLSLMAFIVLLLLTISSLVRVDMTIADQSQDQLLARQNALLGLTQALGELQAKAGPDQRVTATGSLWENPALGTEHYVGVWRSDDLNADGLGDGAFEGWLVSRSDSSQNKAISMVDSAQPIQEVGGSYIATDMDSVIMLAGGSVSPDPDEPDRMSGVVAEKKVIQSNVNQTLGSYAWWVGDEGVKARINVVDASSEPGLSREAEFELKRANGASMQRLAAESVKRLDFIPLDSTALMKIYSEEELITSYESYTEDIRSHFHDITFRSMGVQSDSRDGGLKKDLSLLFEMSEDNWRNTSFYQSGGGYYSNAPIVGDVSLLFAPSDGEMVDGVSLNIPYGDQRLYGPTWDKIRDYYRLYKSVEQRDSEPVIDARATYPGTAAMEYGTHQKNWSMGVSRMAWRRYLGDNDPFMSKTSSGSQAWGSSSSFPFVRATRGAVSPYLSRALIQAYVEVTPVSATDYQVQLVVLPVIILHNPYNVKVRMGESRLLWSMLQHAWFYKFGDEIGVENDISYAVIGSGNNLLFNTQGRGEAEFVLPPQDFEPGEVRAFVAENEDWQSNSSVPLKPVSAINNSYQGDGLKLPPITLSGVVDTAQVLHAIYSTFPHQQLAFEMIDPEDSSDYNTMIAMMTFGTEQLKGFRWYGRQTLANDLTATGGDKLEQVVGYPLDQMIGTRTAITTFDFYVKPVDLEYPTLSGSPASGDYLRFPSFVASNPLSPSEEMQSAAGQGSAFFSPLRAGYVVDGDVVDTVITDAISGSGHGFTGAGVSNAASGSNYASILEVPTKPMHSIGQLQHVSLVEQPHYPVLAIGNSFSTPFLNGNDTILTTYNLPASEWAPGDKMFYDLSYFANRALWDGYYFSTIAPDTSAITYSDPDSSLDGEIASTVDALLAGTGKLYNPRMQLYEPPEMPRSNTRDALIDYEQSASRLMVSGAFNVNSTSVEAWRALLSGMRNLSIYTNEGGLQERNVGNESAFLRQSLPNGGADQNSSYLNGTAWTGFSGLSDTELDNLATGIVDEIHARSLLNAASPKPFLSLAQFINRVPGNSVYATGGVIQKAIEASGVNSNFSTAADFNVGDWNSNISNVTYSSDAKPFRNRAYSLNAGSAAPTNLLQSDVLQMLGPYLSVRSDTFRIRSYGEIIDPVSDEVTGKVWCEAIVQRVPEPVYPSPVNVTEPEDPQSFGRKFRIVSFRWLDEEEV